MRKALGTLVAAGLLILPACGDDSDDADEPTEQTTGGDTDPANGSDGADNGDGDSGGGSEATEAAIGSGSDFCNDIENLALDLSQADMTSADALQEFFERLLEIDPPAEIADDWIATTNYEFNSETEAANDRVETYISEECGLDPNILGN